MKKIHRKLLRDLWASKGLFLAVTIVIFLGVSLFGAAFVGYLNLKTSYDYTYEVLGMADFTIKTAEDATDTRDALQNLSGVEHLTGRMNSAIAMELPGGKRVEARVISLPSGDRAEVNNIKVEDGYYFEPGQNNVLLAQKSFADHHDIAPGDEMVFAVQDQEMVFTVAGIATSPEYIFPAKSRQEILISSEVWGVVFIPEDAITDLMGKSFMNEFCFLLEDGSDVDATILQAEEALASYGVMESITKEDQPSNAGLQMDLQEFGEIAEIFPMLFLIVGAMATYILLTRIVFNQRTQIGVMRAMGYSRRQVLFHYLSFALIIGILGSVLGTIVGYLLSGAVTHFYVGILGLPYTKVDLHWMAIEEGMFLGILPCIIAGIVPAFAASRLSPAETMRTPPPTSGRKLLLEKVFPFLTHLSAIWKIPLRNIFRNRLRSLYTIIGVVFGVTLILVSAAMIDSVEAFSKFQFDDIQRYDAQITFAKPQDRATQLSVVEYWEGMERAEPLLQIPARLGLGDQDYSTVLIGLTPDSDLLRVYSTSGEQTHVNDEGILLSEGLQNKLDIEVGDMLDIQSPHATIQLPVTRFVKQTMGGFAYVSLNQAQVLMEGQDVITGLMIEGDAQQMTSIREAAYDLDTTASVELTAETKSAVDEMMRLIAYMMWIMLAFGAALAMAIVFTTVTVNILERRREIGTMRTIGESKGRIAIMITIENLVLGLAGLVPGAVLGYAVAVQMFSLFQSDMISFGLVIYPRTYVLTAAVIMAIMLISQLPSIRQAGRLNLAQVVKEQAS
ncbi:MAG: FtsX-like permease family protein [Chloroflexota bacterium]|nr:FtsX-like permease family protein [Chloroflexota bacterium]